MTKKKLLETIKRILDTEVELGFLLQLKESEIETLVACIRERVERARE
jgi:hypothetical protein